MTSVEFRLWFPGRPKWPEDYDVVAKNLLCLSHRHSIKSHGPAFPLPRRNKASAHGTMLEVFAYKKYKKHKLEKQLREGTAKEALDPQDEQFIRASIDKQAQAQSNSGSMFKRLIGKKSGETVPPTKEELAAVQDGEGGTYNNVVWR